jgi:uncharacterized DUF497 family protein
MIVGAELRMGSSESGRYLAKHVVSFEEAATVFGDPLGRITNDPRHSADEERCVILGFSKPRRLLAVMFVDRSEAVRILSARRATPRERKDYEKGSKS